MRGRLVLLSCVFACGLIRAVCVPLTELRDPPRDRRVKAWLLLATFVATTGALLWGIAPVVRNGLARCLAAPALGALGGLVGGLAWLYSLRPVWRRTVFYCCTSDEPTWPPA